LEIVVAVRAVPVDRLGMPRGELLLRGLASAEHQQRSERRKGDRAPVSGENPGQTGHGRSLHVRHVPVECTTPLRPSSRNFPESPTVAGRRGRRYSALISAVSVSRASPYSMYVFSL